MGLPCEALGINVGTHGFQIGQDLVGLALAHEVKSSLASSAWNRLVLEPDSGAIIIPRHFCGNRQDAHDRAERAVDFARPASGRQRVARDTRQCRKFSQRDTKAIGNPASRKKGLAGFPEPGRARLKNSSNPVKILS